MYFLSHRFHISVTLRLETQKLDDCFHRAIDGLGFIILFYRYRHRTALILILSRKIGTGQISILRLGQG